ncbi:MAG: hypothetical protein K1X55_06645 [Chitinophagales bacterium]|nr:hypothetical protein [Chitinophagales bacterium]
MSISTQTIEILQYVSIPLISGFIGWFTNWVAIWMTFNPIEFFGIKKIYLGWQGIIPAKAPKMAGLTVDMLMSKLINVDDLFKQLDPQKVRKIMEPALQKTTENIVHLIMREEAPAVWERIPINIKKQIYDRVERELPTVIEEMFKDIQNNIHDLIDFKQMVVAALLKDKKLMNEIFLRCGKNEFRFIEHSGWYFGMLFGLIQAVIWYFYKGNWVLPFFGVLVGYATNWLALKLIFEPATPRKFLFWNIQGLFIKRQPEVSDEYGKIMAEEVLNAQNVFEALLNGPTSYKLLDVIERNIHLAIDSGFGNAKPLITLSIGTKKYLSLKGKVIRTFVKELPDSLKSIESYTDEAFDLKNSISNKLRSLSPDEFVGVLRPVFQEDEWILILVGAVLGGVAGLIQLLLVFGVQ